MAPIALNTHPYKPLVHPLYEYDKGTWTKRLCLVALTGTYIAGIAITITGITTFTNAVNLSVHFAGAPAPNTDINASLPPGLSTFSGPATLYGLLLTILVISFTEGLGFIHTVFLRWSRHYETTLEWNSDLRLLTTSRATWSTRSISNVLYFCSLATAYTSSAQIFAPVSFRLQVPFTSGDPNSGTFTNTDFLANGTALVILGTSLLVQALLMTWICISGWSLVKTWSSNPLNNALAILHDANIPFRSAQSSLTPAAEHFSAPGPDQCLPRCPVTKQPSLLRSRPNTRYILWLIWTLPLATTIWAIVILVDWQRSGTIPSFAEFGGDDAKIGQLANPVSAWGNIPSIQLYRGYGDEPRPSANSARIFVGLLIIFAIQLWLTSTLHCAELIVIPVRAWADAARHLTSTTRSRGPKGAELSPNFAMAFVKSGSAVMLTVGKSLAHWLFSRSLLLILFFDNLRDQAPGHNYYSNQWLGNGNTVFMFGVPTIFLALLTISITGMMTYLARRSPRGPQPSTFGHLKRLMAIVDDWDKEKKLFWGDKGEDSGNGWRKAGTADYANGVGPVIMGAEYI